MYAYADESGHSGTNLCNTAQPIYYAGALISLTDPDVAYKAEFEAFAKSHNVSYVHAAELGIYRLSELLPRLTKLIKRDTLRFFIGSIDKKWFIVTKFFDFLFDPIENRAAPRHIYLCRQLRILMLVRVSQLFEEQDISDVWISITEANYEKSKALLLAVISRLESRVHKLPDQRSRQVVREVVGWAIKYPEELGIAYKRKRHLLGHYPNVALFTPLMVAIQKQSEYWNLPVKRITHDRQSQFQSSWREIHHLMTNASDVPFHLIGGPEMKLRSAPGSNFVIGKASESPGIQIVDIVLWLTQRLAEKHETTPEATAFLARVLQHSDKYDMSFEGTVAILENELRSIMSTPMSPDKLKRGVEIVNEFEKQRKESMLEFENEKNANNRVDRTDDSQTARRSAVPDDDAGKPGME